MMVPRYFCKSSRLSFSPTTVRYRNLFWWAENCHYAHNRLCNKAIRAKHIKIASPNRSIGNLFPDITEFTNCKDYLRKSLAGRSFDVNSDDWEYLLDQIVETLPAEPDNEQDIEETKGSRIHTL